MNITLKPEEVPALVLNQVLSPQSRNLKPSAYGTVHYHTGFTVPGYFTADAGLYQPVPGNGFANTVIT
jgi:hypothetical protein